MKPAILIAAAFALSLGGSTTVLVLRAGPPVPADSAAAGTEHPDSASASSAAPDTARAAATDSSAAGAAADSAPAHGTAAPETDPARVDTSRPTTVAPAVPPAPVAAAAASRPTPAPPVGQPPAPVAATAAARDAVYRQLSRIYSAMKPSEAAEVLSHLGEEDVIGILSKFGARQAAQILGAMPRERAAALSQRLLLESGAPQGSR
jgi:hypothetical protein